MCVVYCLFFRRAEYRNNATDEFLSVGLYFIAVNVCRFPPSVLHFFSVAHARAPRSQEVYVTNTHLYMAMDLIEGGNLAGRCRFKGEAEAAVVVRQIVRALRYLHDRNIAVSPTSVGPFLALHSPRAPTRTQQVVVPFVLLPPPPMWGS